MSLHCRRRRVAVGQLRKSVPNKGRDYTDADQLVQGKEKSLKFQCSSRRTTAWFHWDRSSTV